MPLPAAALVVLFEKIIIPELALLLARRQAAGQPPPSKDEILANMNEIANRYEDAGEAFLRSKGAL